MAQAPADSSNVDTADPEESSPNMIVYRKIEDIVTKMQDDKTGGVPIRTVKSFLSKIPSVVTEEFKRICHPDLAPKGGGRRATHVQGVKASCSEEMYKGRDCGMKLLSLRPKKSTSWLQMDWASLALSVQLVASPDFRILLGGLCLMRVSLNISVVLFLM